MATKHIVTDSKGAVHKRTSAGRVYSHAVVIHFGPRDADETWKARPGYSKAEWASTRELAEKNAMTWRKGPHSTLESVEIIPAQIVEAA